MEKQGIFQIRVSNQEFAILENKRVSSGLNISEFVKDRVFHNKQELDQKIDNIIRELKK